MPAAGVTAGRRSKLESIRELLATVVVGAVATIVIPAVVIPAVVP
jgi:hypothetical protein